VFMIQSARSAVTEAWVQRYQTVSPTDVAVGGGVAVAVDGNGNVIATGNSSFSDLAGGCNPGYSYTAKYDGTNGP